MPALLGPNRSVIGFKSKETRVPIALKFSMAIEVIIPWTFRCDVPRIAQERNSSSCSRRFGIWKIAILLQMLIGPVVDPHRTRLKRAVIVDVIEPFNKLDRNRIGL